VNGTIPDASDFNDRFNALKNRINNGIEQDNIANGAVIKAKILDNAVDASKIDETDDYAWTGEQDFSGATIVGLAQVNGMVGSHKNLAVLRAGVATVDVDADFIIVWDSSNNAKLLSAVNLTAEITSSGANGLDAGSEASGTWYYIWVIYDGTTTSALLSTSATAPTLPSGYTYKALVSAVRNDGSSNFVDFNQKGKRYSYATWQAMASGNVGLNPWVAIDTTAFIPSVLSDFAYGIYVRYENRLSITNDNSVSLSASNGVNIGETNYFGDFGSTVNSNAKSWKFNIKTANTLYWISNSASNYIWIHGFEVNKI